jgi:hypothetical protein
VGGGCTNGRGEGELRRLRWWYMVDGLHIPIGNRTRKPLAIALSEVRRRLRGRDDGVNVTNVQYKSNWNCHYEPPPYHESILIKNYLKKIKIKQDVVEGLPCKPKTLSSKPQYHQKIKHHKYTQ